MADIRLRIEVNSDADTDKLQSVSNSGAETNNASIKTTDSNFQSVPTEQSNGREMLVWDTNGLLSFNDDGYLANANGKVGHLISEQDPDQFVWDFYETTASVVITISGENIDKIVVFGDPVANQFPTEAILDEGTEYEELIVSDDYQWAIQFKNASTSHTIKFTKWNRNDYNPVISAIRVMLKYIEFDNKNILSVNSLSQSTGQPKEITYGVIANSGSAEAIDNNGEILDMIESGVIPYSNLKVELYANGKKVQGHLTNDSDYIMQNNTFDMDFQNSLSELGARTFNFDILNVDENGNPVWKSAYEKALSVAGYAGFTSLDTKQFNVYYNQDKVKVYGNTISVDNSNNLNNENIYITVGCPIKTKIGKQYRLDFLFKSTSLVNNNWLPYIIVLNHQPKNTYNETEYDARIDLTIKTVGGEPVFKENGGVFTATSELTYIILSARTSSTLQQGEMYIKDMVIKEEKLDEDIFSKKIVYGADNKYGNVRDYFKSIKLPYAFVDDASLDEQFTKFCLLGQVQLSEKDNGSKKFMQARPIRHSSELVYVVQKRNQFSVVEKDVFVKNKYEGVEISTKSPKIELQENAIVTTITKTEITTPSVGEIVKDIVWLPIIQGTGLTNDYIQYGLFAQSESKYSTFSGIKIGRPKNRNFDYITKIYDKGKVEENNQTDESNALSYEVTYKVSTYSASATLKGSPSYEYTGTIKSLSHGNTLLENEYTATGKLPLSTKATIAITGTFFDASATRSAETEIEDASYLKVTGFDEKEISLDIKIRTELNEYSLSGQINASSTVPEEISLAGVYKEYKVTSLKVDVYGEKRTISFEDVTLHYGNNKNVLNLTGSEVLQVGAKYVADDGTGTEMTDLIAQNILDDYKNGVPTARVTVSCSDYYDEYGVLRKEWANGDVLQIGDIVRIDNDNNGTSAFKEKDGSNVYWKIVSRNFKYNGIPLIDLEVQKVKTIY